MLSRREEEKNEKIIRGLMKLPPNRKCINCNSLGPQYVCINFWTFVCMTCSGIHREFTHRVKSVSMAKFTSQEVESLQNGGNQRARDIYLKDWDLQRQRLPDNSNVDKVREFIKSVYVDKKYSGGKNSERPPRDLQRLKSQEDDKRRASSYHSYSQSPPYDHQYEDRRYGKSGAVLTRKPGSDRGIYEGQVSGFVYSPRLSVRSHDERFANEISQSPDYSVSSGGDPFRSGNHSPIANGNFGFGSPPINPSGEISVEDPRGGNSGIYFDGKRDGDKNLQQKTASFGSLASVKSTSSASSIDATTEPGKTMASHQDNGLVASSAPQPSYSVNSNSLSFFELPDAPQPVTALPVDLFQSSTVPAPSSVNLFQTNTMPTSPPTSLQHAHTSPPAFLDLFADSFKELPVPATSDKITSQLSVPKNGGWATFDLAQPVSMTVAPSNSDMASSNISSSNEDALGKFNNVLSAGPSMPWSSVNVTSADGVYSSVSIPWNENASRTQNFSDATSTETWNAFGDSDSSHHGESIHQNSQQQFAAFGPSSVTNQYLGLGFQEDLNEAGAYRTAAAFGDQVATVSSHVYTGPSHTPLASSLMGASYPATELKSTNPFDLPFESSLGAGSMFLDMSSVQAALPNASSSPFLGEVAQPWFSQNPVAPTEGGLGYLGGLGAQASNSQLSNVPVQAPITSMGGNPFA